MSRPSARTGTRTSRRRGTCRRRSCRRTRSRAIREYVDRFLAHEIPRLEGRIAERRIRDCHGDLQAQHVCCIEPLQIFDCIEFNHRFRFGDTAAEIAFLAMDLERLGAPALAMEFLNAYLEETGDYGTVALLDFYRAYRAFVSAKVLAFQVSERPEQAPPARALFDLATRFARRREPGRILLMSGVMGSGKSTVGRHIAACLGAIVVRTDAVRKRLAGVGLRERSQDSFGTGLYTPEISRRAYEEALRLADEIARAGWPVIVDGSFSRKSERAEVRALAERLGVAHATVWCDAGDRVIAKRLERRARDAGEVSDGRVELLAEHRARYEPPEGEPGVVRVDTEGEPDIARAVEALERPAASAARPRRVSAPRGRSAPSGSRSRVPGRKAKSARRRRPRRSA